MIKDANSTSLNNYFWNNILKWYKENKRVYPWRETNNPFHILLAEFLLQQTHVRKVEKIYNKLISKYPDPKDLASADVEEIEDIIRPLGLLYRANRMKKSAEKILLEYEGKIPRKLKELKELPGVGEYIGEAVRSYGFGEKAVPIDTNVIRLFTRFFGFVSDNKRPRNDKELKENIRNIYSGNLRKRNLAVLDFAAQICTVSDPDCIFCPLSEKCKNFNQRKNRDKDDASKS